MEREYAAACRRLSGDWRALERGWTHRRRALRTRRRELGARADRLRALAGTHARAVSTSRTTNYFGLMKIIRAPLSAKFRSVRVSYFLFRQ